MSDNNDGGMDLLNKYLSKLNICLTPEEDDKESAIDTVLKGDISLKAVAKAINEGKIKNIITMVGAGISVSAGIPDFRTPGTGLYDNLQKYDLPEPTDIFDIEFFQENPKPFCILAKELYPGNFAPTKAHYFIRLLNEKGVLLRNFTQNIDTLERIAGIPGDKIVEAHGSFSGAYCIDCDKKFTQEYVKEFIFNDDIPKCDNNNCNGLVKPNITFFGESLPPRFFQQYPVDFEKCDLLIVMGTSLKVHPFASLINEVQVDVPRVLINREKVGESYSSSTNILDLVSNRSNGFIFEGPNNYRDIAALGNIDDIVDELIALLGWDHEFSTLITDNPCSSPNNNNIDNNDKKENNVVDSNNNNDNINNENENNNITEKEINNNVYNKKEEGENKE